MKLTLTNSNLFKSLLKLRYLYVAVCLVAVALFFYLGFFLYEYLYQTIAQSEKIILLKSEVAPNVIDMKEVETTIELINKKGAPINTNWSEIKNPFNPLLVETVPPLPETATSTPD